MLFVSCNGHGSTRGVEGVGLEKLMAPGWVPPVGTKLESFMELCLVAGMMAVWMRRCLWLSRGTAFMLGGLSGAQHAAGGRGKVSHAVDRPSEEFQGVAGLDLHYVEAR